MQIAAFVLLGFVFSITCHASDEPIIEFLNYECSRPIALHNFDQHLANQTVADAINWSSLEGDLLDSQARLTFEVEHLLAEKAGDVFTWRQNGEAELTEHRRVRGRSIMPGQRGRPLTTYQIQGSAMSPWPEFGLLVAKGSQIIVDSNGAIIINQAHTHIALCKMMGLHTGFQSERTIAPRSIFSPSFKALEPWLRELISSDTFEQAINCSSALD